MAVLVRCNHCGAPHRVVAAGERFRCDYCRGWNVLEDSAGSEELVCPTTTRSARIKDSVLRHLHQLGLSCLSVKMEARVPLPVWQLVSQHGEELFLPAALRHEPVITSLQAPALHLVSRDDPKAQGIEMPASALEVSQDQAEAAALASFQESDSTLQSVRLIWLSLVPLRVRFRSGSHTGFYLDGADRVLLGSLPDAAGDEALRPELALGLTGFLVLCLVLGALCRAWGTRILVLLACAGASWFFFRSILPTWVKERRS